MKRGRSLVMALAVLALAPLPLLAQGGQGPGRGMGMMGARLLLDQGSVEFLVTKASDLALDADQTKKLTDIGTAWAASTKEAREKIRKELPQPGQQPTGDREAMMARMQAIMPLAQQVQEEDTKSLEEAMKVLNADQQTKAKGLLDARREAARPRRPGG